LGEEKREEELPKGPGAVLFTKKNKKSITR